MTTKLAPMGKLPVSASSPALSATKSAKIERLRQGLPKPAVEFDKNELRKRLTPLQFRVTQEKHTERAFSGEYLKTNERGKFCCVVCDEELFTSDTKFDSGCGWPAFSSVIDDKKIIAQADLSHVGGNLLLLALRSDLARTEVICANCGAHLGHVFDDGPKPTGKRYCVNSASLSFKTASSLPTTAASTPMNSLSKFANTPTTTTCDYSLNGTCQMPPSATALICQRLVEQERQQQTKTTSHTPTTASIHKLNNSTKTSSLITSPVAVESAIVSPPSNTSPSKQPKPKLRLIKRSVSAAPPPTRKHLQTSQTSMPGVILDSTPIFTTKPQNRVSRLMSRFSCSSKKDKFPPNDINNNPENEPVLLSVQNKPQNDIQVQSRYLDHFKPEIKKDVVNNTIATNRSLRARFLESDL